MISASTDAQQQETLIEKYMQLPNQVRNRFMFRIKSQMKKNEIRHIGTHKCIKFNSATYLFFY